MGLTFQVADGGFLDIDVTVRVSRFLLYNVSSIYFRLKGLMDELFILENGKLMESTHFRLMLMENTRMVASDSHFHSILSCVY